MEKVVGKGAVKNPKDNLEIQESAKTIHAKPLNR